MKRHSSSRRLQSRGFTLIEILIAITVLSFGLLGLAALQITSLQNNQQSYQRTQASALAYDITDRMRANRATTILGSAYPAGYAVTPTQVKAASISATSCAPSSTSVAACSGANLAAWDVSNWAVNGVQANLTGGTASITCSSAPCTTASLQIVTVMWDEFRTGATGTTCPLPSVYDRTKDLACFSVSFVP